MLEGFLKCREINSVLSCQETLSIDIILVILGMWE